MNLKWPLSRGSQFKLHFFTWGDGETEDRTKVSTSPLLEGSSIDNNELRDNTTRTKCMAIQTWLETIWQIRKSKYMYDTKLLVYFYP